MPYIRPKIAWKVAKFMLLLNIDNIESLHIANCWLTYIRILNGPPRSGYTQGQ